MKVILTVLCLAPLGLWGARDRDEAIHRLSDGTLIEGTAAVREEGVLLRTPFGERLVARSAYQGREQTDLQFLVRWYGEAARTLERRDLAAHRELAEMCRARGFLTGLRAELCTILASDTDDRWSRQILAALARDYQVHRFEGQEEGREARKYIDFLFEELAVGDNVGAVIAAEKAKVIGSNLVFRPAMKALRHTKPRVRWLGAHVLRHFRDHPERITALWKCSLKDGVWAVRREAVRALKATGDASLMDLYAHQLTNPKDVVRVRAAQALGELGYREAAAPLVRALQDTWHVAHNNIAIVSQASYVKDYDVEVAQTAFIADPLVDMVQDGLVLDAGVVSIGIVRYVYRNALRRITGQDFGTDAAAWRAWLEGK